MDFINGMLNKYGESAFDLLVRLVLCVAILALGTLLIRWIMSRLASGRLLERFDRSLFRFFLSFVRIGMYVLLFITAATVVGIPMTSFVTLLASAGVAIGLALQGALSNLAGGVMLLIFKPFKIGDFIEISAGKGKVTDITVFYTKICTVDNRIITVPNGQLTNSAVINCTAMDVRRIDLHCTAPYGSDIDNIMCIMRKAAKECPRVLDTPEPPFAALCEQKDSALDFELHVWCKTEDYWNVYFDIRSVMNRAFVENGVEIPFPQLDIHTR